MTSRQLSDAFWASEAGRRMRGDVESKVEIPEATDHSRLFTSKYGGPLHVSLRSCLRRAVAIEWRRNWPACVVRWLLALCVSLVAGSIFWQLPVTFLGGVSAMGMVFWIIAFVLSITVPTAELTYSRRAVVVQQRRNRFYPGWIDAVPQVLVNLPILVVDVLVVGVPLWFMVGFTPAAGPFFMFLAILLALNIAADNFFRLLGSVIPNLHVGVALGVTIYLIMELLAGFTISPAKIPQPWRAVHYVNPLAYAFRAAALNELRTERWTSQPAPAGLGAAAAVAVAAAPDSAARGEAAGQQPPENLSQALIAFFELDGGPPGDWVGLGVAALLVWAALYVLGSMAAFSLYRPPATKAAPYGGSVGAAAEAEAAGPAGGSGGGGGVTSGDVVLDAKGLAAACPGPLGQQGQPRAGDASAPPARPSGAAGGPGSGAAGDIKRGGGEGAWEGPPFEPAMVAFVDVRYYVPHPAKKGEELELLRGITGRFDPGRMAALMGSSGAGKTTLMDVIAGRKTTGRIMGDITINGHPVPRRGGGGSCSPSAFLRRLPCARGQQPPVRRRQLESVSVGYVEQTDLHVPLQTVGEALRFAAALRLPAGFGSAQREELVSAVMALIELEELEGSLVGIPGQTGLSGEQRKRLTIGVELVTNPSVLFLDEPSSGLDSRSAAVVMGVVRQVASLGRTVICTIHQPSAAIFASFDDLLLLRRGGSPVYCGPVEGVVQHLAALPGAPPQEPGRNPASWMLEAVAAMTATTGGSGGGGGGGGKGPLYPAAAPAALAAASGGVGAASDGGCIALDEAYSSSSVCREAARRALEAAAGPWDEFQEAVARRGDKAGAATGAGAASSRRPGACSQLRLLLRRNLLSYWRDPGHNLSRYAITLAMAVIIGTVELGKARHDHLVDARAVQNAMGAIYMMAISLAFEAAYEAQSGMAQERAVYSRERAAGTYGPGPYLLAQALVEAPFLLPQACIYSALLYAAMGMRAAAGGFFFALLVVLASAVCMILFAQALVHVTPVPYLASLALSVVGGALFNVTCGFMAPAPTLPPWWRWFYYMNPMAYSLYAITADQLGGVEATIPNPLGEGSSEVSVREYLALAFGIERGGPGVFPGEWGALLMLCALSAGYLGVSYCCLRFLQHQKR